MDFSVHGGYEVRDVRRWSVLPNVVMKAERMKLVLHFQFQKVALLKSVIKYITHGFRRDQFAVWMVVLEN